MQSPQYYFSTNLFPVGFVLIGGVNDNIPISTLDNVTAVIQALDGGATPLQILNRQFVAMQLNAIPNGPYGGPLPSSILNSTLRCYRVNFTPTQLSNGFTLSRDMTFGQLLAQAQSAIFENRTSDMPKIATVMALLNGNDPGNRCQ